MSAAAWLWVRVVAITTASVVLLVAVAPDHPPARVPGAVGACLGLGAGVALFCAITRARPRACPAPASTQVALMKLAFLGIWAANEEVIWRRVALGELLRAGALPALAASTVGFAFVHRTRRAVHLATGGAFGIVYLSTGFLVASVAAHWAYNGLVAAFVAGREQT